MMKRFLRAITLPRTVTAFERAYLRRVNWIALLFFIAHIPTFGLVAWAHHTNPLQTLVLTSFIALGPAVAFFTFENPRSVSIVHGISAMFMGGLLVHVGRGPVQIEMHFYFFALIAMCAVFGNPMVVIAAAVTVASHHLIVWLVMPRSVFNYDAEAWVVAVHAAFVVLESIATCFIAKSFFTNVIRLESIVNARTAQLDAKNRDMRVLLDNMQQGFLTIDITGALARERSTAMDRWFGAPAAADTWFDYLRQIDPDFALASEVGWSEVRDDVMPLEVTIAQMPRVLTVAGSTYEVDYRPLTGSASSRAFQISVTDISDRVRSERVDEERREIVAMVERLLVDRTGVETFIAEGSEILARLRDPDAHDLVTARRLLHTLKGTAAMFGLQTVARACHALEDRLDETGLIPRGDACHHLDARWTDVVDQIGRLLQMRASGVEVEHRQVRALRAAADARDLEQLAHEVRELGFESTERHFEQAAAQAAQVAIQTGRQAPTVTIENRGIRLDPHRWAPFWSAFGHAIRNAVDHGLEADAERGPKPPQGQLWLRSYLQDDCIVIEVEDDGRGIDWETVRGRAIARGLAAASHHDLVAALFGGGVSTASAVTSISGRGVGMSALVAVTRELGGELAVHSTRGMGTRVQMTFPRQVEACRSALAMAS